MANFMEGIKRTITGKTAIERKQEAAANSIIRQKVLAAELKEREVQSIKIAQESVRAKAKAKLQRIRQPQRMGSSLSEYKTYGSPFGQPRFQRQRVVTRTIKGKKGKLRRVKRRVTSTPSYSIKQTVAQPRHNVLGNW